MDKQLISDESIAALEQRIQSEEFSSRLYEDMSLWFEDKGYNNLAKVYKQYSEEELEHAGWAKKHLLSFGLKPKLKALISPEAEYTCCNDILEATLEHELSVSKECRVLTIEALKRGDIELHTLGLKYCTEQIDEVQKSLDFLDIKKLTVDDLIFDQYIGQNYLV